MDKGLSAEYYLNRGVPPWDVPAVRMRRHSGDLCDFVDCPMQKREVHVEECHGCDHYNREEGSCDYK